MKVKFGLVSCRFLMSTIQLVLLLCGQASFAQGPLGPPIGNPVPEWPDGESTFFLNSENLQDISSTQEATRSHVFLNLSSGDATGTMEVLAGVGNLSSTVRLEWDSSNNSLVAAVYAQPGSPIPTSFEFLGNTDCGCGDPEDGFTLHMQMAPAPDLFGGASYVLMMTGTPGGGFASVAYLPDPMLASWWWPPSWFGGGGGGPAVGPPPGPAVPPPSVSGPMTLPPLPPGVQPAPGVPPTIGTKVAQWGIQLGKLGTKRAKCALLNAQLAIWQTMPGSVEKQRSIEAIIYWIGVLGC